MTLAQEMAAWRKAEATEYELYLIERHMRALRAALREHGVTDFSPENLERIAGRGRDGNPEPPAPGR